MNAATSDSVLLLGAAGCVSRYRRGHELCRGDEAGQADGLLRGRLRYSTHRTHLAVGDCDKKNHCCGAGAGGAEIILGPGARAENKF